jgi:hypothetical protein
MSFFQFSVLFGIVIVIFEMWFTRDKIDKSREELEIINISIGEIKELLESIDEKLERS